MTICSWCGCRVEDAQADSNGYHLNFYDCTRALKRKVQKLTQELVDERVYSAALTEALENCVTCPLADHEETKEP